MNLQLTGILRFLSPKNILIFLLLCALLLQRACQCTKEAAYTKQIVKLQNDNLQLMADCQAKSVHIDTASRRDTQSRPASVPQPKKIVPAKPATLKHTAPKDTVRIDSVWFETIGTLSYTGRLQRMTDSLLAISRDPAPCADTVYYDDVEPTKYGAIGIRETVSGNRILSRKLNTDFAIPTETRTVIKEVERKRTEVYLGINAFGTKESYLKYAGASLALKTKRDLMYEAGVWYGTNKDFGVSGSLKFKLSFRKK